MRTFSHWGSLVSESQIYFQSKYFERSFRFFKYSRWIIVSYLSPHPFLLLAKEIIFREIIDEAQPAQETSFTHTSQVLASFPGEGWCPR